MIRPDEQMSRDWPEPVMSNKPLFATYSKAAHATGLFILGILADKLGVSREEIASRHRLEESAGDHVRITRGPARKTSDQPEIQTPSHTDFGT